MKTTLSVDTESPDATRLLGERVGEVCVGGEILLLSGDLGAGKTHFAQGLARGLGVPPGIPVTSPTFVLHNQYVGRLRLDHIDLYRLGTADADLALAEAEGERAPPGVAAPATLDGLGLDDWWNAPDGVCAVEWPEVFGAWFSGGGVSIRISNLDDAKLRRIQFNALDDRHAALLDRLVARLRGA